MKGTQNYDQHIINKYKAKPHNHMIDPFSDVGLTLANNLQGPSSRRHISSGLNLRQQQYKLPKIQKGHNLRDNFARKIYAKLVKSSAKMPIISQLGHGDTSLADSKVQRSKMRQKSEGDNFVAQIQKKLKVVLKGQKKAEHSDSDEDFQAKIGKNKQIIRKQKMKRQDDKRAVISKNSCHDLLLIQDRRQDTVATSRQVRRPSVAIKKQKSKMDSSYEKTGKQSKQSTIANRESIKRAEMKQIQDIDSVAIILPTNKKSYKTNKKKLHKRHEKKSCINASKNQDLFESIHNILLMSNRRSQDNIVKQRSSFKMQKLQSHLKSIQQRLSSQKKSDLQLVENLKLRRLTQIKNQQYSGQTLMTKWEAGEQMRKAHSFVEGSDFDIEQQLERINIYFSRNQRSMEKYIQNQYNIANIQMMRAEKSKIT